MAATLALFCLALVSQCRGFLSPVSRGDLPQPPASSGDLVQPATTRGDLGGWVRAGEGREVGLEEISGARRVVETGRGEESLRSTLGGGPGSVGSLVGLAPSALLNLAPLYLPHPAKVNPECRRDLLALYTAFHNFNYLLKTGTLWPLKLVDSWGKFADGMLVGNLKLVGFFSECVSLQVRPHTLNTSHFPELQEYLPGLEDSILGLKDKIPGLQDDLRKIHGTANYGSNFHSPLRLQQSVPDIHSGLPGLQPDSTVVVNASFQGQYCLLNYGCAPKSR